MNQELSPYQRFIALSRYARYLPDEHRRETWEETVTRYCDYMASKFPMFPRQRMYDAIINMRVMPSMRAIMTAGAALERDQVAGFNCAYMAIDDPRCFDESMYILMCGCGVGFSVERQFIKNLPEVAEDFHDSTTVIHVEDSRIGWAQSLRQLISLLYAGHVPSWDISQLRLAGVPLRTFGGRASGPEPLVELFQFCITIFRKAAGRRLNSRECHDIMCKIGDIVVSGGVRRSALLSLSNLSDQRMALAKSGQWWETEPQRALANNSVAYTEKPEIGLFMKEWVNLYESKSGERGIFNRSAATRKARKYGRRHWEGIEFGGNPCQPAFAPVLTPGGISGIGDIKIGDTLWSEDGWVTVTNKQKTGVKPVYRYRTTAGVFYGTAEHRIVEDGVKTQVQNAEGIDILKGPIVYTNMGIYRNIQAVVDGLVVGDGSYHPTSFDQVYLLIGQDDQDYFTSEIKPMIVGPHAVQYGKAFKIKTTISMDELDLMPYRVIPERYVKADMFTVANFLRGLYSANGSVVMAGNVFRVTLKTTSSTIVEQVQTMLSSLGISSFYTTNKPSRIAWANGTYTSRISYDVNITGGFGDRFASMIGFLQEYKNKKLENAIAGMGRQCRQSKTCYEIRDTELLGEMEVFDITVSGDHHTYWSGGHNVSNCVEITLRPNQFCNLTEVVIREDDTPETLTEKVEIATILGTFQSMLTDFRYLRSIWKKNVDEERLLGVSLTGIMDNRLMAGLNNPETLASVLDELRLVAVNTNKEWARMLGIPQSVAVTTGKPSGTVSQLVDAASGIHRRFARHYIRTVRNDKLDPLSAFLVEKGVPHETDVSKASNWVFSFPVRSPANACVVEPTTTAIEQLEHYLLYVEHWAEHNISVTIYVREHEWLEVGAWVYKHFDDINGVSFLPYSEHIYKQAPYQEITEEEYERLAAEFPAIDFNDYKTDEYEDNTQGSHMLACVGNACEIS